jgi:hypothetical protein
MPKTTILCWRTTLTTKSGRVTVEDYERWRDEGEQGKGNLATLIKERLRERYVDPIDAMNMKQKNGFAIMALSCLLVETLESFYCGWPKSPKSGLAFSGFFDRHATLFPAFKGYAPSFFSNVRCGIMHQGETTQGWTITRKAGAQLFDPASLTVHAVKFNRVLGVAVDQYSKTLGTIALSDGLWENFIKKMNATIKACC